MPHAEGPPGGAPGERAPLPDWLTRLIMAHTPEEVAGVVAAHFRTWPGCTGAWLTWCVDAAVWYAPQPLPGDVDPAWLDDVAAGDEPVWQETTRTLALRLLEHPLPTLLVTRWRADVEPRRLPEDDHFALRLAGLRLERALSWNALKDSHQRVERSEALQRALFAISDLAGSDRDMAEVLRGIHATISSLMYAENIFIVLRHATRDTVRFLYYVDRVSGEPPGAGRDMPMAAIKHTLTWYVIHDGKARRGDARALREQIDGPVTVIGEDSYDWLGVPMLQDGHAGGALVVQSYDRDIGYTAEDQALLEFVASHVLIALERKQGKERLEREVELRTHQLAEANRGLRQEILERQRGEHLQAALYQLAGLAIADIDQRTFYERVHEIVGQLLNAENFFIALLSDDGTRLTFPYFVDSVSRPPEARPLGRGLSEFVLRHGRTLRASRPEIEALARRGELVPSGMPAQHWLGVPLRSGESIIGIIVVQSYRADVGFGEADQELLGFAASQIATSLIRRRAAEQLQAAYAQLENRVEERTQALRKEIVERERAQDQLRHQVMHDALTGLANRSYLRARIERVLGTVAEVGERCALLYLDVDRFKIINDSLGHLAGDTVLREVATRLAACVRHPDLVARISGDEFAILLEEDDLAEVSVSVAQRVLDALDAPMQVAGRELQVTASVGIAIDDRRYANADEMLRDADIALYRAKQLGRKRYELFDETLARSAIDVLTLEGELRRALLNDEFEPYFQPIRALGVAGMPVVGHEALIRWNHPTRGVLAPGEFLKVAEDSSLIETIDWRLYEHACRHLARCSAPDTFLTVNVSARHLRYIDFDERFLAMLERTGAAPERLVVEVTEGALLDNPERVRMTLEQLRAKGVGSALDDFGTGYSSLSYLHSLPLRILKIDRSFVDGLDKHGNTSSITVVEAILALARALDIRVIAEGIETPTQRDVLLAMGCDMGQGFLLGRPAPCESPDASGAA